MTERKSRFFLVAGTVVVFWGLVEFPAFINLISYEAIEASPGVFHNLRFTRIAEPGGVHHAPPHSHYAGQAQGGLEAAAFRIPASDQTLYRWNLKYDQNGFRNARDLTRADMVVIGDSMVEGMTVPDAELTTSLLERFQHKVVANLGQFGFGPVEELQVLERYGLPLRPRTVIWMFFEGNDLTDIIRDRKNPRNFWNLFLERSFTRLVWRAIKRLFAPEKPLGITRCGVMQMPNGGTRRVYFFYIAHPLSEENLSALNETFQIAATAEKLSAAQRARLLFVFIPDKFRVYHDFCQFPPESECRRWAVSDLPQRMQRGVEAISSDIGYLDLTPNLVNAVKQGELPYYSDDIHWSAAGDRVAAEAINDYLMSQEKP